MNDSFLAYAKSYADQGYQIFPCQPDAENVDPDRRKSPITKNGCKAGTSDIAQIEEWWKRTPNANIGLHCTGLIVLDIDGANNPYKSAHHRELMASGCCVATSPRGGTHYFFRKPKDFHVRNSVKVFAENVDVRTDGGYVIVAPSMILGHSYTWVVQPFFGPDGLPEPPDFVLARLAKIAERQRVSASNVEYTIPTSASADRIYRYVCTTDRSVQGQKGSDTTFGVLGRIWWGYALSDDELRQWAPIYSAERCDPPWSDGELQHKVESVLSRWLPLDGRPRGHLLTESSDSDEDADVDKYVKPLVDMGKKTTFQKDLEEAESEDSDDASDTLEDPGPIPVEWFYEVPGLVKRIIQYSTDFAPHPYPWTSFAGALAMMSVLTARVICDQSGTRTNLYVLGLGLSSCGKDFSRFTNSKILSEIGLEQIERNSFASSESVEDMVYANPVCLCQTDEINGLLEQVSSTRCTKSAIVDVLLQLYTSSKSHFILRSRAGKKDCGRIVQPHLVVFGTAIPKNYYASMNENMISGGLLSRMFVVAGGQKQPSNENANANAPIPEAIIRTAKLWLKEQAKHEKNPSPSVLTLSEEARGFVRKLRDKIDNTYYKEAEQEGDNAKASVWGRVVEQSLKLALLYTASDNLYDTWVDPGELVIGLPAVEWGAKLAIHQAKQSIWNVFNYQADSKIQADCQAVLELLKRSQKPTVTKSELLRKIRRLSAKEMGEVLDTLEDRGEICREESNKTGGRKSEKIALKKRKRRAQHA